MLTSKGQPQTADEVGLRLAEVHGASPQREMHAKMALAKVREGLGELASLGHQFMLVEGEEWAALQFPQMIYKAQGQTVTERIVSNSEELADALKNGWVKDPKGNSDAPSKPSPSSGSTKASS
jgi:hypothetical protein